MISVRLVTGKRRTRPPEQVADQPADLVNSFFYRASGGVPKRKPFETAEREREYPEPSMFGLLPAWGVFVRHARDIDVRNARLDVQAEDRRPAYVLDDVEETRFDNIKASKPIDGPTFVLQIVRDFRVRNSTPVDDATVAATEQNRCEG